MRRFYELADEMESYDRWHLGLIHSALGPEVTLTSGIRLEPERQLHAAITHPGPVPDFCETSFGVPIATAALAQAIRSVAGTDVQCLPVDIPGHTGIMVLNATRLIRCVDEGLSDFVKWTKEDHRADLAGKVHYFWKLVVDRRVIPDDAHFFRIEEGGVELIVSDAVKAAMERVGCVGAKFVDVNPEPEAPATGDGA